MLKLIPVKEFKDGSASYEYEYDKSFEEYYKRETGAKVVRKINVGKFITRLLTEMFTDEPTEKCKVKPVDCMDIAVNKNIVKESTSLDKKRVDRRTPKK